MWGTAEFQGGAFDPWGGVSTTLDGFRTAEMTDGLPTVWLRQVFCIDERTICKR